MKHFIRNYLHYDNSREWMSVILHITLYYTDVKVTSSKLQTNYETTNTCLFVTTNLAKSSKRRRQDKINT